MISKIQKGDNGKFDVEMLHKAGSAVEQSTLGTDSHQEFKYLFNYVDLMGAFPRSQLFDISSTKYQIIEKAIKESATRLMPKSIYEKESVLIGRKGTIVRLFRTVDTLFYSANVCIVVSRGIKKIYLLDRYLRLFE